MIRSQSQYEFVFNTQAAKYLKQTDRYIEGVQQGFYFRNGGVVSLLFNFGQASIDLSITNTDMANNVLDKIITIV